MKSIAEPCEALSRSRPPQESFSLPRSDLQSKAGHRLLALLDPIHGRYSPQASYGSLSRRRTIHARRLISSTLPDIVKGFGFGGGRQGVIVQDQEGQREGLEALYSGTVH